MYCVYCGIQIHNDSKFCTFCGMQLPSIKNDSCEFKTQNTIEVPHSKVTNISFSSQYSNISEPKLKTDLSLVLLFLSGVMGIVALFLLFFNFNLFFT